jgi:hypothetical protein
MRTQLPSILERHFPLRNEMMILMLSPGPLWIKRQFQGWTIKWLDSRYETHAKKPISLKYGTFPFLR